MATMTKTMIIVILDESGLMAGQMSDVLGGFNVFIDEQKQVTTDQGRLYLIKFNTSVNVVHNGLDLKYVPALTQQTYRPGGGTALYDAIADAVSLGEKGKNPDERVICVIMTEGEENSSRKTTKQQVKELISGHEKRGDWTFIYIGQNPEQWAANTGTPRLNVTPYVIEKPFEAHLEANFACIELRESEEMQLEDAFSSERVSAGAIRREKFRSRRPTSSSASAVNTRPNVVVMPTLHISGMPPLPPLPYGAPLFPPPLTLGPNPGDSVMPDDSVDTQSFEFVPTPNPNP